MSDITTHTDDLAITTQTRYEIRDITEHVTRVRDDASHAARFSRCGR
jgi:hypothetical protein